MSTTTESSRRSKNRERTAETRILRLCPDDSQGTPHWLTADLIDLSSGGIGISTAFPLAVGISVAVNGRVFEGDERKNAGRKARVCWCLEKADGSYRSGLAFDDLEAETEWKRESRVVDQGVEEQDHYEVLQLSPGAHPDTVHRVYRMLAQRYHPDNTDTGNEETFKKVLEAYQVLQNSETRAAFDVRRGAVRRARWNLFQSATESRGVAGERRKRQGILALLYARRMSEPDRPATSIRELEDLLGCPRDHLQVSLWYLKEKGLVQRDDRGQYSITVDGVDERERWAGSEPETQHLLSEGKSALL